MGPGIQSTLYSPLLHLLDLYSIGVKPLYPHICVNQAQPEAKTKDVPHWHTPVGLGSLLTSLPCSLSFWWSNINLISLIREAKLKCSSKIQFVIHLLN